MSNYSIVNKFFTLPHDQKSSYIIEYFGDDLFDSFIAQKGLEKIFRCSINENEKEKLVSQIACAFRKHEKEIFALYDFVRIFFPISDDLRFQIEKLIKNIFDDSLTLFYYYLGQYVFDNPLMIGEAKQIVVDIANKTLTNDLSHIKNSFSLNLVPSTQKLDVLEQSYLLAIKLGALREKYDAISFGRETIESINLSPKPALSLKLKDQSFEYGLQFGSAYHNLIGRMRADSSQGMVYQFYECYICKYCVINCIDENLKKIAISLLKRQFSNRTLTDSFFYYTGDIPSFLLSIISYLYANLLLLMFCTTKTMKTITFETIKNEVLWGDVITNEDLNLLIKQLKESSFFHNWIQYNNDGFIIGRWQFDYDISISEVVNKIVFNSQGSSKLGEQSNRFGKAIYEKIVRGIANQYGWEVISHSIHKKENGRCKTDIDLLAYKSGVVLIGQVKVANCGRSSYEIWKAKQILSKAIKQTEMSMNIFKQDIQLLFSILKKEKIVSSKKDIKALVPIVITRSSYHMGMGGDTEISIISLDMYQQILAHLCDIDDSEEIVDCFKNLFLLYDLPINNTIIESHIDQNEYSIVYEELLIEDEIN